MCAGPELQGGEGASHSTGRAGHSTAEYNRQGGWEGLGTAPPPPPPGLVTTAPSLAAAAGLSLQTSPSPVAAWLRPDPHGNWTKAVGRCHRALPRGSRVQDPSCRLLGGSQTPQHLRDSHPSTMSPCAWRQVCSTVTSGSLPMNTVQCWACPWAPEPACLGAPVGGRGRGGRRNTCAPGGGAGVLAAKAGGPQEAGWAP